MFETGPVTSLVVVLLIALFCVLTSRRLKVHCMLCLLASGMLLGFVNERYLNLIDIPVETYSSLGIIAAILLLFEGVSRIELKKMDDVARSSLRLVIGSFIMSVIFMSVAVSLIVGSGPFPSLLFSLIILGTSQESVSLLFRGIKDKLFGVLHLESLFNAPLMILLPFIILDFFITVTEPLTLSNFVPALTPFLQLIIVGIGTGLLTGLLAFRTIKMGHPKQIAAILLVVTAVLTYVLAEYLGGDGIIAVTTLALLFGNVYIKNREPLHVFLNTIGSFFRVLVFILLGVLVIFPWNINFIWSSVFLFAIFLLLRFAVVSLQFGKTFSMDDLVMMTLNVPKGAETAIVLFLLATFDVPYIAPAIHLGFAFLIYSLLVSALFNLYHRKKRTVGHRSR